MYSIYLYRAKLFVNKLLKKDYNHHFDQLNVLTTDTHSLYIYAKQSIDQEQRVSLLEIIIIY